MAHTTIAGFEPLEARTLMSSSLVPDARNLWNTPDGRPIDAVVAADFDGDGDTDLVASSGRRLAFFENTGVGAFARARVQTLQVKANVLTGGMLDGRPGADLLAIASDMGGSGRSAMRALYFNRDTRSFQLGAVTMVAGSIRQAVILQVFQVARQQVLVSTVDRVLGFFMPTRTEFEAFARPAFPARDGETIAGIAVRRNGDSSGLNDSLVVGTNAGSNLTLPGDRVARVYNVTSLVLRLSRPDTTGDPSPSLPLHTYPGGRLDAVAAGQLDNGLPDIIVSGFLQSPQDAIPGLQVHVFTPEQPGADPLPPPPNPLPTKIYGVDVLLGFGESTIFVRAVEDLNADGRADVVVEQRNIGQEMEAVILGMGLYQQAYGTFSRFIHSREAVIPGVFPAGAAVLAARVTAPGSGASLISLRSPTFDTPDAWSFLAIRRSTQANKAPVVQQVQTLGPAPQQQEQYFAAAVFDSDTVRGGSISRVELWIDVNANCVLDESDLFWNNFSSTAPAGFSLSPQDGQSIWYIVKPGPIFPSPDMQQEAFYLVRACDEQGAASRVFGFSEFV